MRDIARTEKCAELTESELSTYSELSELSTYSELPIR